jgi:hypothetical protein
MWLARATFRLDAAGWWGSLLLLCGVGVSAAITFWRVDASTIYRALGYSESQIDLLGTAAAGAPAAAASLALVAVTLGYMLAIRRHFRRGGS